MGQPRKIPKWAIENVHMHQFIVVWVSIQTETFLYGACKLGQECGSWNSSLYHFIYNLWLQPKSSFYYNNYQLTFVSFPFVCVGPETFTSTCLFPDPVLKITL
jgi:hypothetical protein